MQRAVFLDRDGTIIEDTGYPHERHQVRFLPGAAEAIRILNERGFAVVIVTNQAGVARGYFTEETLKDINGYISDCLARDGAHVDRVYYCPHHLDGIVPQYKVACDCRKPEPGLILRAAAECGIDLAKSVVIGDMPHDVEAGRRAGCRTVLLAAPGSDKIARAAASAPSHVAADLREAVEWLVNHPER